MERVAVTLVERRLRRADSVDWSFLCALRYSAVQASLDALSLLLKRRLHLAFRNRKTWPSVRASLIPCAAAAAAVSPVPDDTAPRGTHSSGVNLQAAEAAGLRPVSANTGNASEPAPRRCTQRHSGMRCSQSGAEPTASRRGGRWARVGAPRPASRVRAFALRSARRRAALHPPNSTAADSAVAQHDRPAGEPSRACVQQQRETRFLICSPARNAARQGHALENHAAPSHLRHSTELPGGQRRNVRQVGQQDVRARFGAVRERRKEEQTQALPPPLSPLTCAHAVRRRAVESANLTYGERS